MQVFSTVEDFRKARTGFADLGFVPTMGFLHEGHLSLVRRAKAENGAVAVSIFVNPTQFGPTEDLSSYPRDLERDLELLREAGADLVFTPDVDVLYPQGFVTKIDVAGVAAEMEGRSRPGHFSGVATVVTKLFNIVQPQHAYFGQKDAQQCAVVQRFVRDLDIPVRIVVCETSREEDGLARSSRNVRLSAEDRLRAPALYRALTKAAEAFQAGERRTSVLEQIMSEELHAGGIDVVDYATVVSPDTFLRPDILSEKGLALLAVKCSGVRLIDNMLL
ncbi:pantoate--beta-alanine ligase [Gluconobacter wancherniae]|uniref:Pantothenate synthetase n=1 Tax=Gluconobacter wancherniae NBRC 103581 TaxID=656744 RepID=A0A511AZ56_9PROT|nr:pantoate--beta-alanine ligase [Gluconobacter wancherniae]MBF0852771.1 pantoate--beta-alanine ligase [Gluconobacter wancherniae]GBD56515.1 pantothenate synthetase [Gluconobacter wancherniae NBRC 103581]GBR64020.1 pantoate--beta-alanine ligase [Gluconobacter wancherniae NBRC 103581]GEK92583.1 pantothenate synthetase [Gluconobacter wancherniae NBRC 103581]